MIRFTMMVLLFPAISVFILGIPTLLLINDYYAIPDNGWGGLIGIGVASFYALVTMFITIKIEDKRWYKKH